jgi:hypothetical protein
MAFPYGICHHNINEYVKFLTSCNTDKTTHLLNQYAAAHDHLPRHHIRKQFDVFGKKSGNHLTYTEFLTNIAHSEFVISTSGDRDDCYRHYECIGLNAIPISNIKDGYKDIFGENMIYSNAQEMIQFLNNRVQIPYQQPNRDMVTISYWVLALDEKMRKIETS